MNSPLTPHQLRVTSAVPGRVKFELDIQKEHTVSTTLFSTATVVTNSTKEPNKHPPWRNHSKHGYEFHPTTTSIPEPLTLTMDITVDLGGSLAVASRGLFATGVSTDLNVTYLSSGGKIGDLIKAEVTCDKCKGSCYQRR